MTAAARAIAAFSAHPSRTLTNLEAERAGIEPYVLRELVADGTLRQVRVEIEMEGVEGGMTEWGYTLHREPAAPAPAVRSLYERACDLTDRPAPAPAAGEIRTLREIR